MVFSMEVWCCFVVATRLPENLRIIDLVKGARGRVRGSAFSCGDGSESGVVGVVGDFDTGEVRISGLFS